ncbi:hypothetical protein BC628DRAFT_1426807 [Trametes gibbosa]|nr:hypothetical protein BC628DRAFT_1426807 [Trametes gibbosa]
MKLTRVLGVSTLWILHTFAGKSLAQIVGDQSPSLSFHIASGGNDNYFLRDDMTSGQLLLTSTNNTSDMRRLVVALPAGNSGALVYFLPKDDSANSGFPEEKLNTTPTTGLGVTLMNGSFKSATADYFNVGVQADLAFNRNATLGVTIIGAVRAMRDYVEGGGTMHEIFNYTLASYNETSLRLHRQWINTTSADSPQYNGADLYLNIPSGSPARLAVTLRQNDTRTPPVVDIIVPEGGQGGTVTVKVVTNETSLPGLNTQQLFLQENTSSSDSLQRLLEGLADGDKEAAQQVSFLTYKDKFTAGGWRFLTYFGRDSLIALRLLMPILTSEAIESALGAVIERTNLTGALCHEETIGDYASFVNMQNGRGDLGNQPFYDYKMIDTDLLLLPALSHYFLELPQGAGRAAQFLAQNATLQNGTYAELLNRTIAYNLGRATPFALHPTASNLLALRPGQPVGNWRDSNEGLGFGVYPFDVNSALVPASLRATQALLAVGAVTGIEPGAVGAVARVWEEQAPALFEVRVGRAEAEARLRGFVQAANLSESLLRKDAGTGVDVRFYALSLKEDGRPVEVLNSDLGFNLAYGANVSREFMERTVDALQPYPRGLLTDVGMVVANPAYGSNTTLIDVLDRAAYHGTVVWSFQQGLMAAGLARQLALCAASAPGSQNPHATSPAPEWCADVQFVQSVRDAQTRLWAAIRGAPAELFTEVWSYAFDNATNTFSVADLGALSSSGTESDAVQLWSYGFLALADPAGANANASSAQGL